MLPFPFEETIVKAVFGAVSHASFLKPVTVFFGSVVPWVAGIWFTLSLIRAKSFKLKFYYLALAALGVVISRGIITEAAYNFIYIPRPFEFLDMAPVIPHALQSGMPSGHMAFLTPLALAFVSMKKRFGFISGAFIVAIGAARMAGGVHWASDIVAGILVGIAGFLIAKAILPKKLSIGYSEPAEIDEPKRLV